MAGTQINSFCDSIDEDERDRHTDSEVSLKNRTCQKQEISMVEKEIEPMKRDICLIPQKISNVTAPLTNVEGEENEGNVIDLEEMRAEHN